MTSFPWVDFGRLLIYFILGLSLKDNGKKNYVAIFLRSNAILTRLFVRLWGSGITLFFSTLEDIEYPDCT